MRSLRRCQALGAAATMAMLAGCSGVGSSAIAPGPASLHGGARLQASSVLSVLEPTGQLKIRTLTGRRFRSFYSCPAKGPIVYVSDRQSSIINVYVGKFAGQAPCAQITSGVNFPQGLYVDTATHDLYAANFFGFDVIVFHRGQTSPYNTYTDSSHYDQECPLDVAVARDGTVIASNAYTATEQERGSISTWIGGPNGGKFVGNFPMTTNQLGGYVTVNKSGTVYFNDIDNSGISVLWSLKCPAGACGPQTRVPGVSFDAPGGMAFDAAGDLLVTDAAPGRADTFEFESGSPHPKAFPMAGFPRGMAINDQKTHWFVADENNNNAAEYSYPSGALIGTVPGIPNGLFTGVAFDD